MKINLSDGNITADVQNLLEKMKSVAEKEQKSVLKRLGDIIKKSAAKNMKFRSGISKSEYVHMQDDVQVSVKTSKYGKLFVQVAGGRKTGYKWRFLNDGAIDNKGNVLVQATHFMESAIKDGENEISKEIDTLLEKVVNADGR